MRRRRLRASLERLAHTNPVPLWEWYLQLTEVEGAFKRLTKGIWPRERSTINASTASKPISSSPSWPTASSSLSRPDCAAAPAGWLRVRFSKSSLPSRNPMGTYPPPTDQRSFSPATPNRRKNSNCCSTHSSSLCPTNPRPKSKRSPPSNLPPPCSAGLYGPGCLVVSVRPRWTRLNLRRSSCAGRIPVGPPSVHAPRRHRRRPA